MSGKELEEIIAEALEISVDRVRDDLKYGDIHEWDSLNHVELMLSLESAYDVELGEDEMIELTSVRSIREFLADRRTS